MRNNQAVIEDSIFILTGAYLAGALAFRQGIPWGNNPNPSGSDKYDDWDYGHTNEAANEHTGFSCDIITATRNGKTFERTEQVKRDIHGNIVLEA